jgi:hypothetical protein
MIPVKNQFLLNRVKSKNQTSLKNLLSILALLILTGCYSYDINGEQPVRYASGVRVVSYDSTVRQPANSIQVFDSPGEVKRPYHKIALLSRPGNREDQALVMAAIIWRARHLGADGIIFLPVIGGWPEVQFSGHAIVFVRIPSQPIRHQITHDDVHLISGRSTFNGRQGFGPRSLSVRCFRMGNRVRPTLPS